MCIKYFVDENIGYNLVKGLRDLGFTNVEHVLDTFKPGEIDEVWLEYVGKNNLVLITKDKKIRKNPKEKWLLMQYSIVAFYLGGDNLGTREISIQLIKAWDKMEAKAKSQQKKGVAGAFIIRPGGGKIEEIPLA
jgi:hypothetical protein